MRWGLVVPLKPLVRAKSRLAGTTDPQLRAQLALAFASDTVAAALACAAVREVAVVTDDAVAQPRLRRLGARILPDLPGAGLNAALAHGASSVRQVHPTAAVAAMGADLPALRPAELARVLHAAAGHARSFLADAAGTGTTLLAARPDVTLSPDFGPASRARHLASGAVELAPGPVDSVRQDVDTAEDLRRALRLGVGAHTAARAQAAGRRLAAVRRCAASRG